MAVTLPRAVHINNLVINHSLQLMILIRIKSSNTTSPRWPTQCKLCRLGMVLAASVAQQKSPSIRAWLATAPQFTGKIRIRWSLGFTRHKSCQNSFKNRCCSWNKAQTLSRKKTLNWKPKLRYLKTKWVAKSVPSRSFSNRINSSRTHRRQIVGHWLR